MAIISTKLYKAFKKYQKNQPIGLAPYLEQAFARCHLVRVNPVITIELRTLNISVLCVLLKTSSMVSANVKIIEELKLFLDAVIHDPKIWRLFIQGLPN